MLLPSDTLPMNRNSVWSYVVWFEKDLPVGRPAVTLDSRRHLALPIGSTREAVSTCSHSAAVFQEKLAGRTGIFPMITRIQTRFPHL